eukprot:scaffold19937_cov111-Skeletonema_marinoi.AAC.1
MVLEYCRRLSKLSLIKSSTTLQYGRYTDKKLEQWNISFYTIVTNVNGSLEAVDCYINSARYDMVLEYCRRLSRLSLIRSPTTLQCGRYADKELEQWNISFYTIVTNVNGSLEAVDCYIHSARYDMYGRYADKELEQWNISLYIIVTKYNGSLEAVDCYIHSARYDMVLEYCRRLSRFDLIRSPTTLQYGRYADKELEQWNISLYIIVTNVNGSLEAVDCYINSARYDM